MKNDGELEKGNAAAGPYRLGDKEKEQEKDKEPEKCCQSPLRAVWSWVARPLLLVGMLYIFICSLDLLSNAFRLLAGKLTGELAKNPVLENPIVGLMIGILITVLVQSSSTSTSIIITMVGADILSPRRATYMVMGANIGTSVTNTLVAMGQVGDRKQFRRAFAGATVHDAFNWLAVLVLLPLEMVSDMLQRLTLLIVDSMNLQRYKKAKQDLLKTLTKPLTSKIIQLDKKILVDPRLVVKEETIMKLCCAKIENATLDQRLSYGNCTCDYAFSGVVGRMSDPLVGLVLLVLALVLLIACLVGLIKLLNSMLEGQIAVVLKKFINSDKLGPLDLGRCGRELNGYLAILLGAGLTILVQSSSVFTSAITPLVGVGLIELERMFPLTLGANIGTCVTGILAALASDSSTLKNSMQTALVHLFFNICGILIWYPLPFMRYVPVSIAKLLGKTSARYRWFPVLYILIMFLLFPLLVFGLSLANRVLPGTLVGAVALVLIVIAVVKVIQHKRPGCLPAKLRDWKWLPAPLRSLEPYDRLCCRCCNDRCRAAEGELEETEDEAVCKAKPALHVHDADAETQM